MCNCNNGQCNSKKMKCLKTSIILVVAILIVVGCSIAISSYKEEKTRVDSIVNKPLLEWTAEERAEFPLVFEERRIVERQRDSRLWTKEEKKKDWWGYTQLYVSQKWQGFVSWIRRK